jgi:cytochrome c-type biogenesis protein CcmH
MQRARRPVFFLIALLLATFLAMGSAVVRAVDPVELPTPALQARYVGLIHELRCVQCEMESLADSEAPVAGEVRAQVRTMLLAGKSDDQIRDYLVSRYSEFILFRPRYSLRNAWLWLLPVILLAIGGLVAWRIIRARRTLLASDPGEVALYDDDAVTAQIEARNATVARPAGVGAAPGTPRA